MKIRKSILLFTIFLIITGCTTPGSNKNKVPDVFRMTSESEVMNNINQELINIIAENETIVDQINDQINSLNKKSEKYSTWDIVFVTIGVGLLTASAVIAALPVSTAMIATLAGVGALGTGIGTISSAFKENGFSRSKLSQETRSCTKEFEDLQKLFYQELEEISKLAIPPSLTAEQEKSVNATDKAIKIKEIFDDNIAKINARFINLRKINSKLYNTKNCFTSVPLKSVD